MGVLGLTLFALVVNYNIQLAIPPMTVQLQHPIDKIFTTNDSTGTGGRDCGHRFRRHWRRSRVVLHQNHERCRVLLVLLLL
jgi:hypothetical protein